MLMGREVLFDNAGVILKLNGVTAFFALKLKVNMPYNTIKGLYVDHFDAPLWMFRMPGTSALTIYEGSFKYKYFLSYENRVPLVMIELEGHEKYKYVFFEIDSPTKVAADIRKHIRDF